MTAFTFEADTRVDGIAHAYTNGLVDIKKRPLDFSDKSILAVEVLAADLFKSTPPDWQTNPASAEELEGTAKVLGFYVGEVMRRHHGGEWGFMATDDGDRAYAIRFPDGSMTSPIVKAHKRLTNGAEDDLSFYFQVMINLDGPT